MKDEQADRAPLPVPSADSSKGNPEYNRFVQIVADLRSPEGCPWDLAQTHQSIAKNMIEEAYEAVTAIEENDIAHMREELGDVLMQVVLQSQIAEDLGEFTLEDVAHDVSEKMIRRHPHVYGAQASFASLGVDPADYADAQSAGDLWEVIKGLERRNKEATRAKDASSGSRGDGLKAASDVPRSILEDVPKTQPALMQAQSISRKAVSKGFEWDSTDDVWRKVEEEIAEFKAAQPQSEEAELEFGDILFSLVNVARKEHLDAETCLRRACDKFRSRWLAMESFAADGKGDLGLYSVDELAELWKRAKVQEADGSTQ